MIKLARPFGFYLQCEPYLYSVPFFMTDLWVIRLKWRGKTWFRWTKVSKSYKIRKSSIRGIDSAGWTGILSPKAVKI